MKRRTLRLVIGATLAVAVPQATLPSQTRKSRPGPARIATSERESGTARLKEAVAAYRAALEERTRERVPPQTSFGREGVTLMLIADRTNDAAVAETAVQQIETAYETARSGGDEHLSEEIQAQLAKARAIRDRLMSQ